MGSSLGSSRSAYPEQRRNLHWWNYIWNAAYCRAEYNQLLILRPRCSWKLLRFFRITKTSMNDDHLTHVRDWFESIPARHVGMYEIAEYHKNSLVQVISSSTASGFRSGCRLSWLRLFICSLFLSRWMSGYYLDMHEYWYFDVDMWSVDYYVKKTVYYWLFVLDSLARCR
jgi:hypothetical protein